MTPFLKSLTLQVPAIRAYKERVDALRAEPPDLLAQQVEALSRLVEGNRPSARPQPPLTGQKRRLTDSGSRRHTAPRLPRPGCRCIWIRSATISSTRSGSRSDVKWRTSRIGFRRSKCCRDS
jgi:hypothetical protein